MSVNEITGDRIVSKIPSDKFKSGWDAIWAKMKEPEQHPQEFYHNCTTADELREMLDGTKTAAIYVRCSTEHQVSGSSLERQLRYCKRFCENMNLRVIDIVADVGSGWNGTHLTYHTSVRKGNLGRLLKGYEHGFAEIPDFLIYEQEDRFCRDYHVGVKIHAYLKSLGIKAIGTSMEGGEDLWVDKLPPSEKVAIYQL